MKKIVKIFRALGDSNRLRLVNILLSHRELCVCDLQTILNLPQTRVSRHLALLRAAGLVDTRRKGALILYRIACPSDDFTRAIFKFLKSKLKMDKELLADLRRCDHLAQKGNLASRKPSGRCEHT